MYTIKAISRTARNPLIIKYAIIEEDLNNKIAFLEEHYGYDCDVIFTKD